MHKIKKAFILLHTSILLAGFTGIFGRLISMNAFLISWYRLLIAGLLLWLYAKIRGKARNLNWTDRRKITIVGTLLGFHWIFFYASIQYANISVGVVCFSLCSFFTAVLEPLINKRKHDLQELLLSGLTVVGIGLMFGLDSTHRAGIVLGIISAVLAALYTIFNERLTKVFESETITLYTMIGGGSILTLLLPFYIYLTPGKALLPSLPDLGYLLVLSVFCTALLYAILTRAMRSVSAFTVNLSFNLEPLYTIILAMLIYKENKELSWPFYLGLGMIMLSVLLQMMSVLSRRRKI